MAPLAFAPSLSTLWLNWGIASFSIGIQKCSFTYYSFAYYHIIICVVFNLFKLLLQSQFPMKAPDGHIAQSFTNLPLNVLK